MKQIRYSFFETNSSSVHALIFSKIDQCNKLPSTINLSEDSKHGDVIRAWVRNLSESQSKKFITWLYSHGVKKIIYVGSNDDINRYIKELKHRDSYEEIDASELEWRFNDIALINFLNGDINTTYDGHDDYLYHDLDENEYAWLGLY